MADDEPLRREFERHLEECLDERKRSREALSEIHERIDKLIERLGDARVRSVENLLKIAGAALLIAVSAIGFLLARHGL